MVADAGSQEAGQVQIQIQILGFLAHRFPWSSRTWLCRLSGWGGQPQGCSAWALSGLGAAEPMSFFWMLLFPSCLQPGKLMSEDLWLSGNAPGRSLGPRPASPPARDLGCDWETALLGLTHRGQSLLQLMDLSADYCPLLQCHRLAQA